MRGFISAFIFPKACVPQKSSGTNNCPRESGSIGRPSLAAELPRYPSVHRGSIEKNYEKSPAIDRRQTEIRRIRGQFNWNSFVTTTHRDFYWDQVLVSPRQTVFIDFDLFCLGSPDLAVGNYSGHLREDALRCPDYQLVR